MEQVLGEIQPGRPLYKLEYEHELFLESRDGRSSKVLGARDHPWSVFWGRGCSVSNDGRWALWRAERKGDGDKKAFTKIENVLMDIDAKKWQLLPDEVPGTGIRLGVLWFDDK